MFAFKEMIEMGLEEGQEWASDHHKEICICLCICNPNVRTRTHMMEICSFINGKTEEELQNITLGEADAELNILNNPYYS